MPGAIDLTGQRFGILTVSRRVGTSKEGAALWECRCNCGGTLTTRSNQLRRGRANSCGCTRRVHGLSKSPIYGIWRQMLRRCEDPTSEDYKYYGARGITVCVEWHDVTKFSEDMGPRPEGGTLEREDVNGPYSPSNCVWATQKEQTRNARSNILLTYGGETKCLGEWAEVFGIKYHSLYHQIVTNGRSLEDVIG